MVNRKSKTRIISIPFKFRPMELASDIRARALDFKLHMTDIDTLCGVGSGTASKFATAQEDNMKMSTFLKVCNGLDLDPRKYFELNV